jgi:hypothetical protein
VKNEGQPDALGSYKRIPYRLKEADETLDAIRRGGIDAIVVSTSTGEKIFTLKGAEHPHRVLDELMLEGAGNLAEDGEILSATKTLPGSPLFRLRRSSGSLFGSTSSMPSGS